MARTAVLGFPRLGPDRELKFALEDFWQERISADELTETAARLRRLNLGAAQAVGVDVVAVGDFAYYDHVLDTAELVGVIADRHGGPAAAGLNDHFVAACGTPRAAPLALSRWFDTSYHYLVPELAHGQQFGVRRESLSRWIDQLRDALALGIPQPRPVLLGPFSLLALADGNARRSDLLPALTTAYADILGALADAGATEVQLDEPCLVLDQTPNGLEAFAAAYEQLLAATPLEVALATYFGGLDDAVLARIAPLQVAELHVDLVQAPERLDAVLAHLPSGARLSAGVVDGRNVWAVDADRALGLLDRAADAIGSERLTIAPSCSLLHVPWSAAREHGLDPELLDRLAFGEEKLAELVLLGRALDATEQERTAVLTEVRARVSAATDPALRRDDAVRARAAALRSSDYERCHPLEERLAVQAERLQLPDLPTTTMGALPQTTEIRRARMEHGTGELVDEDYAAAVRRQIDEMIALQEMLELDVLVYGEPERRDTVEFFAEQLDGFAISQFGWVQTYGNRAVKPPLLYGDVARPGAMTVAWWRYASGLTERPVKATLTGPVTLLKRSFVRDDQPLRQTCEQIALALQDEVVDLEAAGAPLIQIDEAAVAEGVPLQEAERADYVRWATDCLRLVVAPARPETQIHMHFCEIEGLTERVGALGADVISTDDMTSLDALASASFAGGIGPGLYDVQVRRLPSAADLELLLERAEAQVPRHRLWINPSCGLKTRPWPETIRALTNLVQATKERRAVIAGTR
jgi:5-methyltetrahydropteroyltriglutamate--homocysteine methyltransferase